MKKEKEIKNESESSTKEINKKSIRSLRKVLSAVEIFLIAIPAVFIGFAFIMGLLVGLSGEETTFEQEMVEMVPVDEVEEFGELEPLQAILAFFSYILYICIIDNIVKMFKNIEDEESPFTEKNLRILNKIKKLILFSFITTLLGCEIGMGLFAVIIVYAFVLIFEYGCKIQNEVDEIL